VSLRDENLRIALTKAIADAMAGAMAKLREAHFATLLEQYDEVGTKQFSVALPDGTKVATITLTEKKEAFEVTDEIAFLTWAQENLPEDAIHEVVVPPVPEMRFIEVDPKAQAALIKRLDHRGDLAFDPETGQAVDGITYRPAGRPSQFAVTYVNKDEGRERLIDAWRAGDLAELVGTDVLPAIESGS
jgi:hypothetical protein